MAVVKGDFEVAPPPRVEIEVPPEVRKLWEERRDPIVRIPDEVLRSPSRRCDLATPELRKLVDRMKAAMAEANGVGLAAPQLGVLQRVVIYKLPEEKEPLRVIVNPRIVSRKGEQIGPEGCLSIPLLQGDVKRANEVIVKGADMLGRPFKRRASEFEARVIQHELDHLDGILFVDRADPATLHWITPAEEAEAAPEE
jgi:peptide deformylase